MSDQPTSDAVDELEAYLVEPCKNIDGDVLKWWYDQRITYPRLSRMARDYLSAPGKSFSIMYMQSCTNYRDTATTVDVERVFSKGRILLSHTRNRLSAQNTRALMCVGEWSRMGFIQPGDIKAAVQVGGPSVSANEDLEELWAHVLRTMEKREHKN